MPFQSPFFDAPQAVPAAPARISAAWRAAVLGLVLALVQAAPARADNDWLGIAVPRPLETGTAGVNIRLDETQRQYWDDGAYNYYMIDADGGVKVQDLLAINARLDWRLEPRLVLEADVPVVFSEFAPDTGSTVEYYNLNTPAVEESQGLGDVRLGLRGALKDASDGFNAGWSLALVAPTGLSPFSAPQTLAATGDGRWQALPGFVLGGLSGPWEGWFQAVGRLQFGQQVESSSQAYLDWTWGPAAGGNVSLPDGGSWLAPRYGADCVAGLAWIWYRDDTSRMGLGLEATAHWLSPFTAAGVSLGLQSEQYYVLTPELQARYGRFSAIVGWQAEYIYAVEEPFSIYGDIIFDIAYAF